MKGKLIVFEGVDYSGKTTCLNNLKPILKEKYGDIFVYSREPGNLIKGEDDSEIRETIFQPGLTAEQQAYLFATNRYEHTIDIINELEKGKNVVIDRYFLSSIIYQGAVIGNDIVTHLNRKTLNLLTRNNIVVENIIFVISKSTYNKRKELRDNNDIFENDSQELIYKRIDTTIKMVSCNYKPINEFNANYHFVDARKGQEIVSKNVLGIIEKIIKRN